MVKGAGNKNDHNMEFVTDANSWTKCIGNTYCFINRNYASKRFSFQRNSSKN